MADGRTRRADLAVAAGLVAGTFLYLALLPRVLGDQDEAKDLYQSLRLLAGARWFVDVFDLIPPGFHYLMAGAFAVGGPTLGVARTVDAGIHAAIGLGVFVIARALGVGRGLAALGAVGDLCWARPAWPVASPHWLSTALGVWVAWALLRRGIGRPLVAGILVGALAMVQQQRAIPVGVGAIGVLAGMWGLASPRPPRFALVRAIAVFTAGVSLVLVPGFAFLVTRSGATAVYEALVLHPARYGSTISDQTWGAVGPFAWFARYTFVRGLAWGLPLVGAGAVVLAIADTMRTDPRRIASAALAVLSVSWVASIVYYPDYIHLAIVAPFLGLAAVVLCARAAGFVPAGTRRALLLAASIVSAAALGWIARGAWRDYPVTHGTAFGRMQFHDPKMPARIDALRAALVRSGSRELFVYPYGAAFYLWAGATNPTALQFLVPGYTTPAQYAAVITALEQRRTPLVALTLYGPGDPVAAWVHARYVPVEGQPEPAVLFERRDTAE